MYMYMLGIHVVYIRRSLVVCGFSVYVDGEIAADWFAEETRALVSVGG